MGWLTVWCVRFVQARMIQDPRPAREAAPEPRREIEDLGLAKLHAQLAGRALVFLPEPTGAGPCGTYARRSHRVVVRVDAGLAAHSPLGAERYKAVEEDMLRPDALAWSMQHLLPQLQEYYALAAHRHPKIGTKHGGGNNSEALKRMWASKQPRVLLCPVCNSTFSTTGLFAIYCSRRCGNRVQKKRRRLRKMATA